MGFEAWGMDFRRTPMPELSPYFRAVKKSALLNTLQANTIIHPDRRIFTEPEDVGMTVKWRRGNGGRDPETASE